MGDHKLVLIPAALHSLTCKAFFGSSAADAMRNAVAYLDEHPVEVDHCLAKLDWIETSEDEDCNEIRIEHWIVEVYIEGDPSWPEHAAEIEAERNMLLRRIAELESTLGVPPWFLQP